MYTSEELLNMIKNGTSAETLAQTFTDALNAALDLQNKEAEAAKKKEEEEKKRKAEELSSLIAILNDVIAHVCEFYPSLEPLIKSELTEETIEETAKDLITQFKILSETAKAFSEKKPSTDPIADFFKKYNLL